ncbi:hypothetical protein AJ78_06329 [Emergomyces pasteurianus Ep9510]|uniref:C3H1-type domain-containing protein n=1 Tax=Emergomyces pasteurianus Ep9510 TaxID=1447872 RepID=A0A1J9PB50_9EURO|nr:hypothetical protein AJ78_06329 [Emergomyces pasteurianus Ep9510]
MEPSSNPNPSPASEPATNAYSGEFWSGINPLYGSNQPDGQPFGIGWDHPVFQAQPANPSRPHQQPQDVYSQSQQQWQQSQLQPQLQPQMVQEPQQNYTLQAQYHINHFQQPNTAYDTPQPDPPSYRQYVFDPQNFYPNSPSAAQNSFNQQPTVDLQRVNHPSQLAPSPARSPLPSYERPAPLQRDMQHDAINLANGFQVPHSSSTYHNTIDPQFLSASQHSIIQPSSAQNEYFVINPADLDSRPPPELYQAYSAEIAPRLVGPNQNFNTIQPIAQIATTRKKQTKARTKADKPAAKRKKKDESEKAQDRAKAAASKAAAKQGPRPSDVSASSASGDSDSSSDLEVAPEPFPLPPLRPLDVEGGIKYDTLKAVWSPRNKRPPISTIRHALMLFSELVKGVRDTWKAKSELLKAAENQNQEDKIPGIKKEVILQRRLIDLVVTTALEGGHPAIIQRLGEHPIIVSALYSFLLDRHTAADSDGPLTVNILKLMAKFVTMDQAMLEKTKNDKILTRFVKKGGDVIKQLAQTILSNAAELTKRKAELAKAAPDQTGIAANQDAMVPMNTEIIIHNAPPTAGSKRPREPETGGSPSTKRTVTPSNGKSVAKSTAATVTKRATNTATDAKSTTATGNIAATKPKPTMVVPKPTPSLFSSLMSASKKPGTSNAARAAAAAKEKANPAPDQKSTPPPTATPKPAFSFSETMADLNKPKELAPSKPAEDLPPETEEQRKKRLRKDERRKLRVSWKPDDELTEIRLFTHDPEEEIGHDDSMIRDVGDVGGEGRTLRLHQGLDDLDDDDDPEAREETFLPYTTPIEIDFSELAPEERQRNFIKRGGIQCPESPEKLAQEQREANTLSVFYSSPADIPTSPKEPPAPAPDEPYDPEVPFGEPGDRTKVRSAKYFAARAPTPPQPQPEMPPTPQNSGSLDIASLLKLIQQTPQSGQPQQSLQSNPISDLENTFGQYAGSQGQPTAPSMLPLTQISQSAQPGALKGGLDIQALLAVMNAQTQLQKGTPALLPGPGQAAPSSQTPNLASILSQFQNPAATAQNLLQQQPSSRSLEHSQNQPNQQHGAYYEDGDRKRMREGHGQGPNKHSGYDKYDEGGHGHGHSHSHGHGNKRARTNGDFKHKKHPKAGLVPCRYWKEDKCLKGDGCTFRHDPLD